VKPARRISPPGTYFITTSTQGGRSILQRDAFAELFVNTLYEYRSQQRFQLHAFVVMPDHVHLIITPAESLERAMQFVKGGFSFKASRQFGIASAVWARGFTDHRIRDDNDFVVHRNYIHMNPVRRGLAEHPEQYRFSSAHSSYELDPLPSAAKAAGAAGPERHG
jgi:putative transposase